MQEIRFSSEIIDASELPNLRKAYYNKLLKKINKHQDSNPKQYTKDLMKVTSEFYQEKSYTTYAQDDKIKESLFNKVPMNREELAYKNKQISREAKRKELLNG